MKYEERTAQTFAVKSESLMNRHLQLTHKRNELMAKLLWLFLFIAIVTNSIVDPAILKIIFPTGLIICSVVTVFVKKKWQLEKTPYLVITVIYIFFIILIVYEPLFINFMYIWFALILSAIYQQTKPILLAGLYTLTFTLFCFFHFRQEIFPFVDQEDIVYICLFSLFVTIFLIYASKFNEKLQRNLEEEKRQTEELLQRSDKLAAVGQLAAGVAHEIRNPLSVISGFIQLLKKDQKDFQHYDVMLKELKRIDQITTELLLLSKPQNLCLQTKKLNNIIQEVVTFLETQAKKNNIYISFKRPAEEYFIKCDENQMKQVIINLIKNAGEAMPGGGNIIVELMQAGSYVKLQINDEGKGLPREALEKLGEPFYTTKEAGTGLGLMVSFKIVENHNGKMQFSSEVGKGTTVEVLIPKITSEGTK